MKKFNNKSGFTLIEIIVVLIIVGILAAIALPNIFQNVSKSQASSALTTASSYRENIDGCIALPANNAIKPGSTPCSLDKLFGAATATVATLANDANFTITLAPDPAYSYPANVVYTLTGADSAATNAFTLTRASDGTVSCVAGVANPYNSVC